MPELPEVEVIRRSLEPHLVGRTITAVTVRKTDLRRPIRPRLLTRHARGARIDSLGRRAKYLLIHLRSPVAKGATPPPHVVLVHLGMSGRLTLCPAGRPFDTHEHVAFALSPHFERGAEHLRLRDPRRFGLVEILPAAGWQESPLIRHLGPEPLEPALDADDLQRRARGRTAPVKNFIMDARIVVGVGNIYASEALYRARVDPRTPAGKISLRRWQRILDSVRQVLTQSITDGGTSLVDFRDGEGNRGLHAVRLAVYGRVGEPCPECGRRLRRLVMAGRSTFLCTRCQT